MLHLLYVFALLSTATCCVLIFLIGVDPPPHPKATDLECSRMVVPFDPWMECSGIVVRACGVRRAARRDGRHSHVSIILGIKEGT